VPWVIRPCRFQGFLQLFQAATSRLFHCRLSQGISQLPTRHRTRSPHSQWQRLRGRTSHVDQQYRNNRTKVLKRLVYFMVIRIHKDFHMLFKDFHKLDKDFHMLCKDFHKLDKDSQDSAQDIHTDSDLIKHFGGHSHNL
jgi:hypothetical protein